MANIFDYLFWRGDLSLKQDKFNEVDGMILARLSYIPFECIVEQFIDFSLTVGKIYSLQLGSLDFQDKVIEKEDIQLVSALSECKRFFEMEVLAYKNLIDLESQTQFSAITVCLDSDLYYISFRGTDNTLVGWKEDFNMGFTCPVPSQKQAVQYLTEMAGQVKGNFILGGHSKGGNLAVYAAAFCDVAIQERIQAVYNYDGPGFDETVLSKKGYKCICNRINTFVPQSSIVGMLLGHEEKYTIVHSSQVIGPLQHNIYSWDVEQDHFIYLETVTNTSRFVDFTLKEWIASMDSTQREKFVDTIYMILAETNAHTFKELGENWFLNAKAVLKSIKNLDDETRKAVTETLHVLKQSAKKGFTYTIQKK